MKQALRYEMTRLLTAPATRLLIFVNAAAAALTAAGLCFVVNNANTIGTAAGANESLAIVLTRSPITVLVAGLIGAAAIGHDYKFGTIDTTLLVTPRRHRALTAKIVTAAGAAAVLAVMSLLLSWAVAMLMLGPDVVARASMTSLGRAQAGYVCFVIGWAILGLALAGIFASHLFATMALTVWPFIIEPALRAMVSMSPLRFFAASASYLPYAAGQAMSSVPQRGTVPLVGGGQVPAPGSASLAFLVVVVGATYLAMTLFRHRPARM